MLSEAKVKALSSGVAATKRKKPEFSLKSDRLIYKEEGKAFLVGRVPGARPGLPEQRWDLALGWSLASQMPLAPPGDGVWQQ